MNIKDIRAAGVTGLALLVAWGLSLAGLPSELALVLALPASAFLDRNYRYFRKMDNALGRYLRGIDPPTAEVHPA